MLLPNAIHSFSRSILFFSLRIHNTCQNKTKNLNNDTVIPRNEVVNLIMVSSIETWDIRLIVLLSDNIIFQCFYYQFYYYQYFYITTAFDRKMRRERKKNVVTIKKYIKTYLEK